MLICTLARLLFCLFSRQFHRPAQYWEHAQGSFHLAADLRPVWNWNTGQLFVWVTVEWDGSARSNRVSVWDRIIRTKEEANLDETFDLEYMINDQHSELKGKELTVKLYYDVMPNVGILKTVAAPETCSTKMKMPRQYSS
jgi:hypothetical protein